MRATLLATLSVLAGCYRDSPPATPPTPVAAPHTCTSAGATVARVLGDAHPAHGDAATDFAAKVTSSCNEDHWPPDALACIDAAATHDALQQCAHTHLTQAQLEKLTAGIAKPHHDGGLAITAIEPTVGDLDGGTYVRITGSRFIADGPRNVKVYFGSRQGTVVRFASDTELIVEAPGGKLGEVADVLVIFEPGGELKLPAAFTFVQK